ncbi:MAG: ATP-binding cassette domain-containing protein, partial [Betaproteobacteria bacterium]
MSADTSRTAPAPAAASDAQLLDVERITKRFVTTDGTLTAVDDVSFAIGAGEFVSIIGPSGCGKSTLFNIIGG